MSGQPTIESEAGARVIPFPRPPKLERARGTAWIAFRRRDTETTVADLFQSGCAKVCLPRPAPGTRREAVLVNTAGGLTDDDQLWSTVFWDRGAWAAVTTQAAERIYRSRAAPARVESRLTVGPAATALWLPQETILFDGARLSRKTEVKLDRSARLIACESLVVGRAAMGETVRSGAIDDAWQIRIAGRLVFADRFRLAGDIAGQLERPAIGAGARALATVIFAGPDAAQRLEALRGLPIDAPSARVAASCRGSVLIARILANDGPALRHALQASLEALIGQLDPAAGLPRVWFC